MKEMENNDFIHTLDAVYNLCSEIKERIVSVEITDEEESNDGIILLSDNLQRLQSEIAEMKAGLSSDKDGRDKLRAAINLRLKEINEVDEYILGLPEDKNQQVLEMFYLFGEKQCDIADALGITQGRVSQIIQNACKTNKINNTNVI